jgi:hypothetical protein
LRELFESFLAFVRQNGEVDVVVQKTRICFQVRVRFAGVIVRKRWLECGLWLKRRIESPRFSRIEHLTRNDWIYYFPLTDSGQLDAELATWLHESYAVGRQETL